MNSLNIVYVYNVHQRAFSLYENKRIPAMILLSCTERETFLGKILGEMG